MRDTERVIEAQQTEEQNTWRITKIKQQPMAKASKTREVKKRHAKRDKQHDWTTHAAKWVSAEPKERAMSDMGSMTTARWREKGQQGIYGSGGQEDGQKNGGKDTEREREKERNSEKETAETA